MPQSTDTPLALIGPDHLSISAATNLAKYSRASALRRCNILTKRFEATSTLPMIAYSLSSEATPVCCR